jgi:hypothetical protein
VLAALDGGPEIQIGGTQPAEFGILLGYGVVSRIRNIRDNTESGTAWLLDKTVHTVGPQARPTGPPLVCLSAGKRNCISSDWPSTLRSRGAGVEHDGGQKPSLTLGETFLRRRGRAAELIDDLSAAFRVGRLADALATYIDPDVLIVD